MADSPPLWTSTEIEAATGGRLDGPSFAVTGVSIAALFTGGLVPGAVLALHDATGRHLRVAGMAQTVPDPVPMAADTWFDLASLTKVVFTTTAILRLVEQGRIGLDDPLASVIPDLRQYAVATAAERRLTFRQCLAHQTHLPAVEPLYTYGQSPQTLRAFVLQRDWRAGPPVYSDINFILLGIAIERLTGQALADQPLPPGFSFQPSPEHCAATEFCHWRGRIMRGQVHDENAFALGGAAGHAGLFGTAAIPPPVAWAGKWPPPAGPAAMAVARRRSAIPASPAPGCGSISPPSAPGPC